MTDTATVSAPRPDKGAGNPHGEFIWYELITRDPDAAQAFYAPMLGWSVADSGVADMDYRIASTPDAGVAGIMKTPPGAPMPPAWLGYVGVDDVDAAVASVTGGGGAVHMPAWDVPGVGRMALVADPQGAVFYLMRGQSGERSLAFAYDRPRPGHCAWNELSTTDPAAAWTFYGQRFGYVKDGELDMGSMGKYEFIRHGASVIGAIMPKAPQMPVSAWSFYFRVPDIDVAARHIRENGGSLFMEPMEIPGGEYSLNGQDPQSAAFGLVGPRKGEG